MNTQASQRMMAAFEEAEQRKSFLVATTQRDERWLERAVRRGEVIRVRRGVFALRPHWESLGASERMLHTMRAMSFADERLVFAGTSAALAYGLEVSVQDVREVCLATTRSAHAESLDGASQVIVSQDTPTRRSGVRVTSFLRTIYDCARTLGFPSALAVVDSALRIKGISGDRLASNVGQACRTRPGIRRALDIISLADGRSENGGESKVRARMIKLGFQVPDLQYEVEDPMRPGHVYRMDYTWKLPDGSLVFGELDGKDKYLDADMTNGRPIEETLLAERRRESRITLDSKTVRVMRFSYAEACNERYFSLLLDTYHVPRAEEIPAVALTW